VSFNEIETEQWKLCQIYKTHFVPSERESKVRIALATLQLTPLNGLRHVPEKGTNGWYIWGGKELSSRKDFFDSLHAEHLVQRCPQVLKLLGLPPGYSFLLAGDYTDIWFDSNLPNITTL
jgi:hypothetical protein